VNFEQFQKESNMIEGIFRDPTPAEVQALHDFAVLKEIKILDLMNYVSACQPNAVLRDQVGLDVRVGNHFPRPGGPGITIELQIILDQTMSGTYSAHEIYCRYEHLHPFTDGNGRSGRALWMWVMLNREYAYDQVRRRGFLQNFHYQTLEAFDKS
jgi:hypothetical protein